MDSADIRNGEWLRIKWPTGRVTEERVHLEEGAFRYDDMGHTYTAQDHRAYVERKVEGCTVRLYLRPIAGLSVERVILIGVQR